MRSHSSTAEQTAHNGLVVGSNPSGSTFNKQKIIRGVVKMEFMVQSDGRSDNLVVSKGNISPELLQKLYLQIFMEGYNSQFYLKIFTCLKNMGLDNIAKFFDDQHNDEHNHKKKIVDYIVGRNEDVQLYSIPETIFTLSSMTQLAQDYLNREKQTTESLKAIAKHAVSAGDYLTYNFMIDMLREQYEEEEKAFTFKDKAGLVGDSWSSVLLWDSNFQL